MDGTARSSRVLERFTWFEPDEADEQDYEVDVLLKRLDKGWRALLESSGQRKQDLVEIFLQLGRRPKAIFDNGRSREAVFLTNGALCERDHIDRFIKSLNWQERLKSSQGRSLCFPTTLHRVSFITKGADTDFSIIGINIRIGRSVTWVMAQMCPWVLSPRPFRVFQGAPPLDLHGKSVLLIGRPGSGKTTLIREMARTLSRPCRQHDTVKEEKTVVVVDKINEVAGDFEVPHACIGEARWMPCGSPEMLPTILRDAVESNNPDVVLVDEICTAAEVEAACFIAERGVNIVATVHGNTLADSLNCTVRQALLGGVADTNGRGTSRALDSRRLRPAAFDVAIELHQKDRWILHPNVRYAVDTYMKGDAVEAVELRPGLAVSTLGIPSEDGISYCSDCSPSERRNLQQRCQLPSTPSSGTLGRLPCSASLLEESASPAPARDGDSLDSTIKTTTQASPPSRSYAQKSKEDHRGRRESRSPRTASNGLNGKTSDGKSTTPPKKRAIK